MENKECKGVINTKVNIAVSIVKIIPGQEFIPNHFSRGPARTMVPVCPQISARSFVTPVWLAGSTAANHH